MDSEPNPYAPPLADSAFEDDESADAPAEAPFRDPSTLAKAVIVLTGLEILGTLASAAWMGGTIRMVSRMVAGEAVTQDVVDANEALGGLIFLARGVVELVGAIVFLVWTYRVAQNLGSLGAEERRFSPGWAVGSYFVPILNFFRPLQALAEVWRGSDPARLVKNGRLASEIPLAIWWVTYLSVNFFAVILNAASQAQYVPPATQLAHWQYSLAAVLGLLLPQQGLTIWIVRTLSRNQVARHELIVPPALRAAGGADNP